LPSKRETFYGNKHCAVLVRNPEDVWEGSRTALGVAVGNNYGHLFVLYVIVNMTEELKENMEWLQDMGCRCFSNVKENESQNFRYLNNKQLAAHLRGMDLVIPFGNLVWKIHRRC
jgi:hypothetical protein